MEASDGRLRRRRLGAIATAVCALTVLAAIAADSPPEQAATPPAPETVVQPEPPPAVTPSDQPPDELPPDEPPTLEPTVSRSPEDEALLREAMDESSETVFLPADLGSKAPRFSALQAVRYALQFSPQVLLPQTDVTTREGGVRTAQGEFDTRVTGRAQADLSENRRDDETRPSAFNPSPTPFPNPLVERTGTYDFEVGLRQKLRNGIVLEPKVGFRPSVERDFGDQFRNSNEGTLSFEVLIPLAKGAGRLVNEAPELAARFDLLASVLQLRYATSQAVRETVQAYWRCLAAERRYLLLKEAEQIAQRLAKMSASLVSADELAPAQLPQVIADRNTATASRIRGEADLILARQRLAVAIGFQPESLFLAPLAGDDFPEPPENPRLPEAKDLWFMGLQLRDDLRARLRTEQSRKVLMDAAFLELRPRIDLQMRATYLPFETTTQTSTSQGANSGVFAGLSLDWPIQNNSAIGSYIQNTAAYERSQIDTEDLRRTIISGVISSLAELRSADAEVRHYREAARLNGLALTAQEELFRLGQANLTDTITSRQRLIQSQIEYIGARERYAIALAQLRFETGLLFFSDARGSWIDERTWQNIPLLPPAGQR